MNRLAAPWSVGVSSNLVFAPKHLKRVCERPSTFGNQARPRGSRVGSRSQSEIAFLRVVVGVVFFMHGKMKLMGMGYNGVVGFLHGLRMPLPQVAAVFL